MLTNGIPLATNQSSESKFLMVLLTLAHIDQIQIRPKGLDVYNFYCRAMSYKIIAGLISKPILTTNHIYLSQSVIYAESESKGCDSIYITIYQLCSERIAKLNRVSPAGSWSRPWSDQRRYTRRGLFSILPADNKDVIDAANHTRAAADVLFYDCWSSRVQTDIFITGPGRQHIYNIYKGKHREKERRALDELEKSKSTYMLVPNRSQPLSLIEKKTAAAGTRRHIVTMIIIIKQRASSHLSLSR